MWSSTKTYLSKSKVAQPTLEAHWLIAGQEGSTSQWESRFRSSSLQAMECNPKVDKVHPLSE